MEARLLPCGIWHFLLPWFFGAYVHWGLALTSFFCLLLASYFDNLRGPLLPVFGKLFDIDYSKQSLFLVLGNVGAVIGNLYLLRVLQRRGDRTGALLSCGFTILVCVLSLWVDRFSRMCVLAVIMGIAIAALGACSNVFLIQATDLQRRARMFCGLHMFYGFGSFLGPSALAFFAADGGPDWTRTLLWGIPFSIIVGVFFFRFLKPHHQEARPRTAHSLSKVQVLILLCFAIYVVGEVLSTMWLPSYLVRVRGMPLEDALKYSSLMFLMMGLSRFACFLHLKKELESYFIVGSLLLAVTFSVLGHLGYSWAFVGMGIFGPYFPLLMARVSRSFPEQSGTLTIWILGFVQVALAFANLTVGSLSDLVGIKIAYWFPPAFLLLTVGCFGVYLKFERRLLLSATSEGRDCLST